MKFKITIFDINFVLTFIGFVLLTSFTPFLSSIAIRAICLIISIICISRSGICLKTQSQRANVYLVLLLLIVLRTTIDLFTGSLSDAPEGGKFLVFLFTYGIMLIPLISIISSLTKINWTLTLLIMHIFLMAAIYKGVLSANISDDNLLSNGRIGMNDRQGTLQFATNSSYLLILSLIMLVNNIFAKPLLNNCYKIVAILGIVLAFAGFAKSGSRGAFLASIIVIFYYLYNVSNHFKLWLLGIISLIATGFTYVMTYLMDFAPVLFERLLLTIESGDDERREMFNKGLRNFMDNPVLSDNPLIVSETGFCGLHNMYLDVALFLGLVGILIFLFLYIMLLKDILSSKTKNPTDLFFHMLFVFFIVRGFSGLCIINDSMISLAFIVSCLYVRDRNHRSLVRA